MTDEGNRDVTDRVPVEPAAPSALDRLLALLDESGALVTFSPHCRSGAVGDMCRCWRCRGEHGPTGDEAAAERERELIDRAIEYGRSLQRMVR